MRMRPSIMKSIGLERGGLPGVVDFSSGLTGGGRGGARGFFSLSEV